MTLSKQLAAQHSTVAQLARHTGLEQHWHVIRCCWGKELEMGMNEAWREGRHCTYIKHTTSSPGIYRLLVLKGAADVSVKVPRRYWHTRCSGRRVATLIAVVAAAQVSVFPRTLL